MLKKLDNYRYLIPTTYKKGMQVEGLIYASDTLIRQIEKDQTVDQVANVATLPGWVGRSLAMPDAHQGYGFCIGGVAAADLKQGLFPREEWVLTSIVGSGCSLPPGERKPFALSWSRCSTSFFETFLVARAGAVSWT